VVDIPSNVPVELTRRPPARTLEWAADKVGRGARVIRVRRLRNAWAAAMHAIDIEQGDALQRLVLRRWARSDIPPDAFVVENEAAALTLLEASDVPSPRVVATDPDAQECDAPAVLMTRLPGHDELAPNDISSWIDGLVTTLHAIHAARVPTNGELFMEYTPWNLDIEELPEWSTRRDLWKRAREVVTSGVPAHTPVLCHRDFHPGNVLWRRSRVSGVVDWTHACRAPAAVDVAHCRANLVMLFGLDVADEFARRYGNVDNLAWFDVADVFGMGSRRPDAWRWNDAGRTDIDAQLLIERLDALLLDALQRLA
jgi:aminoglycoside phosphotransferase (APT) family kinase protein